MRDGYLPALAVVVLAASVDAAELRVAVLPFSGPGAPAPRLQIVRAVCFSGDLTCVPSKLLLRQGEADWDRIRQRDVSLVVTGRVRGPAAARVLEIEAFRADESSAFRETLPLETNGTLARDAVQELDQRVLQLARRPSAERPTVERRPPAPEPRGPPAPEPAPAPLRPSARVAPRPLLAVEAGIDLVYRAFEYDRLESPELLPYRTAPFIPAPRIRVEAHPLVTSRTDALADLGVEVDFLAAIGLRTLDENDRTYETRFQRLDIGVKWSTRIDPGSQLLVTPVAGYRYAVFDVGLNADGQALVGVADPGYHALRGGIAAEYPLGQTTLFARAEYVHPLGFGGIRTYFPEVSGAAFELEGGAGYRITGGFELRARAHYGRYLLYFRPAATALYQASGATDDYLGLGLLARYAFAG
jgi:hypothetical protein